MKKFITDLSYKFNISEIEYQRENLTFLSIDRESVIQLMSYLKYTEGFSHFVLMTAVDWIEDGIFQLTYILNNTTEKFDIGIRTKILRENAEMNSKSLKKVNQNQDYKKFGKKSWIWFNQPDNNEQSLVKCSDTLQNNR